MSKHACVCGVIAHLSCSSPWWLQSWPCWVGGWAPLRRAGGWLAASGSYSSGCSSVQRPSSRCPSFSPGLATSSSPPAVPSLRCPNMESCRAGDKTKVGCSVAKLLKCRWERRARMCVLFFFCSWSFAQRLSPTQLQTGPWTLRETVGGCLRSPSHTDQPMGVLERKGCLCWLPLRRLSPLQCVGNMNNLINTFSLL